MPPTFKPNILHGMLYTLHYQRVSPKIAHQRLTRMTGGEVMSLQEVTDLFQKIDLGTFDLRENKEVATVVKKPPGATKSSTPLDQFSLALDDAVRNFKPHIRYLRYEYGAHKLEITIDDLKFGFVYVSDHITATVLNGRYRLIEEKEQNFVSIAEGLLIDILQNENVTVDAMVVVEHKSEAENVERYKSEKLEYNSKQIALLSILFKLNRSHIDDNECMLKVKHLKYETQTEFEELYGVLILLDANSITCLEMTGIKKPMEKSKVLNALFESDPWKKLKNIDIEQPCPFKYLVEMAHANWVNMVATDFPSCEEFKVLLETLFKNQSLNQMRIKLPATELDDDYNAVQTFIMMVGESHGMESKWIYVTYPNSEVKVKMAVRVAKRRIWFRGPCYDKEDWEEGDGEEEDEQIVDEEEKEDLRKDFGW